MLSRIINWMCWTLVKLFPRRHRTVYIEGEPYLLRFYIKRNGWLPGIYLHHFYMGDTDRELHNHPWKMSGSLILTGGYIEERLLESPAFPIPIRTKERVGPGRINIIRADDFHRVDLIEGSAWTIFVSGKKVQDWGFLDTETGQYIPHREYLAEKGRPVAFEDEWAND